MNRIGDSALLLAIAFLTYFTFSVDFSIIFALIPILKEISLVFFTFKINFIDLIGILLIIAAFAKSAQLFLHT